LPPRHEISSPQQKGGGRSPPLGQKRKGSQRKKPPKKTRKKRGAQQIESGKKGNSVIDLKRSICEFKRGGGERTPPGKGERKTLHFGPEKKKSGKKKIPGPVEGKSTIMGRKKKKQLSTLVWEEKKRMGRPLRRRGVGKKHGGKHRLNPQKSCV